MENVLTNPTRNAKISLVIFGHFSEVQDFISQLEKELRSALLYSEIEEGTNFGTDDEADELRATLHIRISVGNELQEAKSLLQKDYKWISIETEGEIEENDDRDNVPNV